jgi:hypothetical protein
MRTTVILEPDVEKAVLKLRKDRNIGVSEAINELIRVGMLSIQEKTKFIQTTRPVGIKIDITSVPDALEIIETLR